MRYVCETSETIEITLYLSGPIEYAKQIIRQECMEQGLCVTVTPTTYIYTGGEESGYAVGIRNYPRFKSDYETLNARAHNILTRLIEGTFQYSGMMVGPKSTTWFSNRGKLIETP